MAMSLISPETFFIASTSSSSPGAASSLAVAYRRPPHVCSVSPARRSSGRPFLTGERREGTASSSLVLRASSSFAPPSLPDSEADALGNVSIYSAETGQPVPFRDLWDQNEGMAVVALLRHFGCPCCWELASTLKESKVRFDSAGVKLIAVGVGAPEKARILAERLPFPLDCLYADPDRKAYDVLGLYYGFGRTFFNPASAKVFSRFESLQKAVKNYTVEATPDDRSGVLQQGGMYIFKGRRLLYARKDEGTGDHAPLDDILNICCAAPVA
ncbi:unnamed protein product [Spirodela intermedia]|uniref:Uncharacterized protein n=1 Tax=Spirodela intermedia TaxID=51605 RepID=A0A7I8L2L6_SPIIN|nr:unnamed protein product [Spirodela intermedia]